MYSLSGDNNLVPFLLRWREIAREGAKLTSILSKTVDSANPVNSSWQNQWRNYKTRYHGDTKFENDGVKNYFEKTLGTLPYIADKDNSELYHKYKRILEEIIRVIHCLGKQNIAFKGHREEKKSSERMSYQKSVKKSFVQWWLKRLLHRSNKCCHYAWDLLILKKEYYRRIYRVLNSKVNCRWRNKN